MAPPRLAKLTRRVGLTVTTALALALGTLVATTPAANSATSGTPHPNPYSPAVNHAYRHGVIPTRAVANQMNSYRRNHPVAQASANNLNYGGGIDGIGVTSGREKVYLVFYGSQWGSQGTDGSGNTTLSGDPQGLAPYLQKLFKGLGTNNDLWSGVMTQYCEGVAKGSQTCPSNAAHVGYPTGGNVLSGVWVDESTASPQQADGHTLGTEAVNAAAHFGNTSGSANRYAQYVIVSPTGTTPDGFNTPGGGFCAWHDYNGDSTLTGGAVSSPYGDIAFTNSPYVPDAGSGCGQNFVNSNGTLDGVSIVEGHEYAETITDQNPAGGWTDSSGAENGDKCAWIAPGQAGGAANLSLSTGSFAMQATWGNDGASGAGACQFTHAIVGGGSGNTVTVTNPGNQTSTVGTAVSLQIHASDSASGQTLTYSASGLPAGLSINSSSGLISGTPTTAGTSNVTVTATDTTNASGSTSFTWTVNSSGGGCSSPGNKISNGGFETGSLTPWSATTGVLNNSTSEPAHTGSWDAWLDGYGTTHTDTLSQSVTIPSGCSATLTFWLHIDTAETTTTTAYDKLTVKLGSTTLATYSNLNHNSGYVQKSFNVSTFAGQTVTLLYTGTEDSSLQTSFVIDDVALNAS